MKNLEGNQEGDNMSDETYEEDNLNEELAKKLYKDYGLEL